MKNRFKYYLIPILVITLFSFMSIGFALYNETVSLNGNIAITEPGKIKITSATVTASTNVDNPTNPEISGMGINFTVVCKTATCSVTYSIIIQNDSFYDYTFTNLATNATITTNTGKVPVINAEITNSDADGAELETGTIIPAGKPLNIKLKLDFEIGEAGTIGGSSNVTFSEDNSGSLIPVSLSPTEGNLQAGNPIPCFTATISNTFKYARSIHFSSENDLIKLIDSTGTTLGEKTINANSTSDFEICTAVAEGSSFATDTTTTNIILSSNSVSDVTVGTLTLLVDVAEEMITIPPSVGNVTVSISETYENTGDVYISWSRTDSTGADIDTYYVYLYNEAKTEAITGTTKATNLTLNASSYGNGTYYAVVYAVDSFGNNGLTTTMTTNNVTQAEALASATTENGYISRSESAALNWTFTVDTSGLSGLASSGSSIAYLYRDYETTLSVTAVSSYDYITYTLPSSITVTMEGTDSVNYTYDSSTGAVKISNVTGNIKISGSNSGTCLIEGTKIRLASGKYKNIEDITYNDLLAVYDHENGGITYEYPIWIEKSKTTNNYQRTTFSDGTILETYNLHAIFSMDTLSYVSVTDADNFKIGTRVAKVNDDGSIKIVTVTNIEMIKEEVKYYQVISTRYHNVISNDFVTSEGTLITTYAFEHNEDLTWTNERNEFLKTNDLFYYEDWTHLFPEHIFKGFRMEEAKHLYNKYPFDIEFYANVLSSLVGNNARNDDGTNLWMVTTNDDNLNGSSKYLQEEGSYYTLKTPLNKFNFVGWYNTADNKIYNPGDKVKVTYGMHFIAKYK